MPDFEIKQYKGLLPYSATYIGIYHPLLGWIGNTGSDWVSVRVGKTFKSLHAQMSTDQARLRHSSFEGAYQDRAPRLLFDSKYSWLWPLLRIDSGQVLKRLVEELSSKKASATCSQLLETAKAAASAGAPSIPGSSSPSFMTRIKSVLGSKPAEPVTTTPRPGDVSALLRLLEAAEKFEGSNEYLAQGFQPQLQDIKHALKWIEEMLERQKGGTHYIASPIGLLDLYRHYYFDLGTFLGPAIEHIWVAPGSKSILTEFSSRTEYHFRETENIQEFVQRAEIASTEKDELSEEVQRQSEQDFRAGTTSEGGVSFKVWHASGTTSLEYSRNTKESKQVARKVSRELSRKASTELRSAQRTLFRDSVETRRESSRRHELSNESKDLMSFEMKRKMQRVGVQVQHLGTQLCWQVYIDEPGLDLGLAELIHIAKPEDFGNTPPADLAPPTFANVESDFEFLVPYNVIGGDGDDNGDFIDGRHDTWYEHPSYIQTNFGFKAPLPQPGYELCAVTETTYERTDSDHDAPSLWVTEYEIGNPGAGIFVIKLKQVNFEKQPAIKVIVKLQWQITSAVREQAETQYQTKLATYEQKLQREAEALLVEALRERIEYARSVNPRDTDDLREEERTLLYRKVLARLLSNIPPSGLHVCTEFINTFFETERMLYLVAPDWWNPRMNRNRAGITLPNVTVQGPRGNLVPVPLGASQRVRFDREQGPRENNYMITEASNPATLGSSIGWVLQLDGDRQRNAFLNSAWVKAVLPIKRGREKEAIQWLCQEQVEGIAGLDALYKDEADNLVPVLDASGSPITDANGAPRYKTVGDALNELIYELTGAVNDEDQYFACEKVYENGFNPLEDGIKIDEKPFQIFAQWIECVPTKQVVPVPYKPI